MQVACNLVFLVLSTFLVIIGIILVKAKVRCPIEYNESTPSFYMIMRYNALR